MTVKVIEEMHSTTATAGWTFLVEDVQEKIDSLKEALISAPYDAYSYGVIQGRIQVYREVAGLREMFSAALKDQENDIE